MIRAEKQRPALAAIQAVFIGLRTMAHKKASHEDLAWILDLAENLPALLLEPTDRSEAFRASLVDLARRHEQFGWALERFDAE